MTGTSKGVERGTSFAFAELAHYYTSRARANSANAKKYVHKLHEETWSHYKNCSRVYKKRVDIFLQYTVTVFEKKIHDEVSKNKFSRYTTDIF